MPLARDDSARRCPLCGQPRPDEAGRCEHCGAVLADAPGWVQPLVERPAGNEPEGGATFRMGALPATIVAIAFRPRSSFARFRWHGGVLRPLLVLMLAGGPPLAWSYLALLLAEGERPRGSGPFLIFLGLLVVAPPLWGYVKAQAAQLVLVLFGVARRPFESTFRAIGYASAAVGWLWLVPLAGGVAFGISSAVLETIALRAAHECPVGVAAVAAVAPPLVLAAAVAAGFAVDLMLLPS